MFGSILNSHTAHEIGCIRSAEKFVGFIRRERKKLTIKLKFVLHKIKKGKGKKRETEEIDVRFGDRNKGAMYEFVV